MNAPLVTLALTCFDAERSIEAALRAALAQDWPNREILVVDDASRDGSLVRIEAVAAGHPEIRVIALTRNIGGGGAYQRLVDEAAGEFIVFFDDDDVSLPGRASAQVAALLAHEAAHGEALCFCDRRVGGPGGKLKKGLTRPRAAPEALRLYMLDAIALHHDTEVYRRQTARFSALRRHGLGKSSAASCVLAMRLRTARRIGFDPTLRRYWDSEFNLRAALDGVAAINVDQPLAIQTETEGDDKAPARARVWTAAILARHAAEYRRAATPYPGFHPAPAIRRPGPKASIGLLSHNAERTLPRAILSAMSQDLEGVEILVLDDGSSDLSPDIARMLARRAPLRTIRSEANLGAGAQRNRLAEEATGEYLAFFDDDDASLPHRLSTQIADLERTGGDAISIASAWRHVGGRLSEAHRSLGEHGPLGPEAAERLVWHTILQHSEGKAFLPRTGIPEWRYALGTSLICGRAESLRRIGFDADMRRLQDLEFLARFTRQGGGLIPSETPLLDVFATRGAHKRWNRVITYSSALIERHRGALERLFGISTDAVLARNAAHLPAIRIWDSVRASLGY